MTNSTLTPPITTGRPPTTSGPGRRLTLAAGLVSAVIALAASYWLLDPSTYPDHLRPDAETGSLLTLIDPTVASSLLLAWGLTGVVLAAAILRRGRSVAGAAVAATYAACSVLLLTDLTLLVTLGYASAILGPPALLAYLAFAATRTPRLWWILAGVITILAGGALLLGVDAAAVSDFGRGLGAGLRRAGLGMIVNVTAFTGGLLWAVVAFRTSGAGWWGDRPPTTTYVRPRRDWGWWVTLLAAAGPLPYALLRMTWLTPWPAFAGDGDLESEPAMRIFGISLGLAAIGAAVLTLGLLARWGTIYPRWVPGVAGRPVSPGWPTLTAVGAGLAITVAGRAMVQMILAEPDLQVAKVEVLLLMPFPVWGPLLVAAAVAYHRRRHAADSVAA